MITKKITTINKKILNKLQLKELENGKCLLSPEKNLNKYYNKYIWKYVQNEVIYSLFIDYKVYFMIYDKEYADIYSEYIYGYELLKTTDNHGIVSLGVYSDKIDMYIITEFTEGTSIWDYTGLMHIFAINERADISMIDDQFNNSNNFILSVEPAGDNEGLYINFNQNIISLSNIKNLIIKVLSKYQVVLECK